jgi:serine/threonine protein kinase/HD-like signal output (HDOD) protein
MLPNNATEVIGRRVGNYVVERALAQGGMGSVFVARHPALGREAAVKFIGHDFEAPPELMNRFLAEARITANLRHPNIVDIFDFGELDGRLYYVMELLHGFDLAALLQKQRKISVPDTLDMLVQITSGLAAAHAVGVVHRDLKPANVFVLEGIPRRVKLMDFGIAKVLSTAGNQTSYGQIMGTPRYMSPEQAVGDAARISPQSDIYSLGVIAYEMLTGVAPFEHESPVMLLIMHVRDKVRPIAELTRDCPTDLAELVEACLNKDPAMRPESATLLLEKIQAMKRRSLPAKSDRATDEKPISPKVSNEPTPAQPLVSTPQGRLSSVSHDDTLQNSMTLGADAFALDLRNIKAPPKSNVEPAQIVAETQNLDIGPKPLVEPTTISEPIALQPPSVSKVADEEPSAPHLVASSQSHEPSPGRKTPPVKPIEHQPLATPEVPITPVIREIGVPSTEIEPSSSLETRDEIVKANVANSPPSLADREAEALALGVSEAITSGSEPEGHTATVQLTESDRNVLNKLLMRMQRRGDFPAFVQNVGEVSKRADCESSFSAQQLGTSILKDYALTAKLLRIVNSAYANRFGGKIYSIQHAIVILGFDRVRQLALSISLFKTQGNKQHASRVTESAINSLVSSEISRELHFEAELDDPEQAVVCSMFRNLGRHLVLVYLPEMYDQILGLMQQEHLPLNTASERVLGISMHKLGVGIAERWRLPQRMIQSMAVIPERTGRLFREEDRLSALAEFSNQLCEIVSSDLDATMRDNALSALTSKHKHLLTLNTDDMTELLVRVQESFEQRYTSLLGAATKTSRFSKNVSHLVEKSANTPDNIAQPKPTVEKKPRAVIGGAPPQPIAPANVVVASVRGAKAKPAVARLQLGKAVADPAPSEEMGEIERHVAALQSQQAEGTPNESLLTALLKSIADTLHLPRLLVLKATTNNRELVVCAGVGEDIDGLSKEFRLPLSPALAATDPFSLAYHANRTQSIEDCFAPKVTAVMSPRYYEVLGSASLILVHVPNKGGLPYVLCADFDPPHTVPEPELLQSISAARDFLVQLLTAMVRSASGH